MWLVFFLAIIVLNISSIIQELFNNNLSLDFTPHSKFNLVCKEKRRGGTFLCFKNIFPQLNFLLRLIQFPFPFLTHKYELHAVVFKVELDRYVHHLSVSFQIYSQTLLCCLFVTRVNPCKLYRRLPCPLESSQVWPVKGPGEKLQLGKRKKEARVFRQWFFCVRQPFLPMALSLPRSHL